MAAVYGTGAALTGDEIVDVAGLDDLAAFFTLNGVFYDFFHDYSAKRRVW